MGIQGLLRFIKDATSEIHIREYAGRCVAVDTYCWLHRGAFACADKLAKGEKTDQYVKYCMKFVDMLESYNVRPILVFDGCRLPSKKEVEKQRRERRELYMLKGKQFLREGKANEARDAFTKCISVTPQMALDVMKAARERGIDCIVAPYEADAQLAYLLKHGYAQAVVTEDSDLLCFGCEKVILKMDLTGRAQEVSTDKFENVKNLQGFTTDSFRHMCIISGCDYLPSIKGVGLVKACKALKLGKNKDIYQMVKKLHQYIKGLDPIEPEYAIGFERADKTFLYQMILDPKTRKMIPLNPYPPDITSNDMKFAGPILPDAQALQIAWGNIDINNGKRIGDFNPDAWVTSRKWNGDSVMRRASIWQTNYLNKSKLEAEPTSEKRMNKKIDMPSLRGKEAIIDVKNLIPSRKRRSELMNSEEAIQLCSHDTDKNILNAQIRTAEKGTRESEQAKLVQTYKAESPSKLSLRQRMRKTTGSNQKQVVKSRFFSNADDGPSFIEESSSTITHVDETPETSNSSYTRPTVENDGVLNDILQEMESTIKPDPSPKKKEKLSLNSIKSPKKQKEFLNMLKAYQCQNEVRTPLIKETPEKIERTTKRTPLKRKNPFSAISRHGTSPRSTPKNRNLSPATKRAKRKVIKPAPIANQSEEDVSAELDFLNKVDDKTEEARTTENQSEEVASNELSDLSCISNEDIPVLDKKLKTTTSNNSKCATDSYHTVFERSNLSQKEKSSAKLSNHTSNTIASPKTESKFKVETITISSDEENELIPHIDNAYLKKSHINVGLKQKTSTNSASVKSKYFIGAKASGLRRKKSKPSVKGKSQESQENLKHQRKITSIFSKIVTKRQPLSPSKSENEVDHTPESEDNTDTEKIRAKMIATRKLFSGTPKLN